MPPGWGRRRPPPPNPPFAYHSHGAMTFAPPAGSGPAPSLDRGVAQTAPPRRFLHQWVCVMTDLTTEILALKAKRGAAILAHNYQRPEIQDVADVVADSLRMARRATELDAPLLVICGVHFMAETAAIANPDKRVLIPDPDAGCSLAATIQVDDVRAWRATHPDGLVVAYVNCNAAVKAEADYCCTSGNAVAVVQALPPDVPVLFVPDFFLGSHVRRITGRAIEGWVGEGHGPAPLTPAPVGAQRREYPEAAFLVHPHFR